MLACLCQRDFIHDALFFPFSIVSISSDINKNTFLGFFTREGLHYYIPAYLIAAITYPDKMQNSMGIIRALTPETDTSWDEISIAGADFTLEEKSIISQFFEVYSQLYPIPDGLSTHRVYVDDMIILERGVRYWSRPL